MPEKLKETADLWKAPIPDYNLGDEKSSFTVQALSYILSGVIGIVLCILILFGLSKLLVKKMSDSAYPTLLISHLNKAGLILN